MLALAVFFFASFGLSFILGQSKISLPLRRMLGGEIALELMQATVVYTDTTVEELKAARVKAGRDPDWDYKPLVPVVGPFLVALWECPGCLGWWTGAIVGAIWPEFLQLNAIGIDALTTSWWGCAVLLGLAVSGTNMLLAKLTGTIE